MIHGLRLAFTGEEIVRALDERIEACREAIQFKRDEIDGKIEHTNEGWQVPAEVIEAEILRVEHRLRTLTMYRERVMPAQIYLLGRRTLKFAGLLPRRPAALPDIDLAKGIRWVTRAAE